MPTVSAARSPQTGLGGFERPATREDGEAPQQMRSASVSRLKLQSIAARSVSLAWQCGPTATGQAPKAIIQPGSDLLDCHTFTRAAANSIARGMPSSW